ncbi:helix-turn-helix domain-containing protein [Oryzobacter telluris]|uniref:arsenate reductase/protein-tyrosine-phosphatase family protein n=1 Tax=Oryzobacter telluris TaxID=3149179 RepID=UPI00370DCA8F
MNTEQTASLLRRAAVHAALADVTRLRIVDLLSLSDRSASELGGELAIPSNLLAHHVKSLEAAGLVTRHRSEGDARRTYLSLDPDGTSLLGTTRDSPGVRARRVLFVCTANTARSHLAAALWRQASTVEVASAGTEPGERINPGALSAARRHHLDLPDVAPRLLAETVADGDLVITVCDRAHEEVGGSAWAHWSVADPVPAATRTAFDRAHSTLAARVRALAPLVSA